MWETQLKFIYKNYDLSRPSCLKEKVIILYNDLTPATVMEIPGTQGQTACEKWFVERWCRLTAYKCLPAYKVGRLVESQTKPASEAFKFSSQNIRGIDYEPFQSNWMLYGLKCEPRAVLKYEKETTSKVCSSGLWVNPKLPFLACSPDSLLGKDTVIEIKSLKIFKQYTVEAVTSPTSAVPKEVGSVFL